MKRPKDYILLYVKGLCMGAADVVPGVSGGTIAFITGIYEELVHSLKALDLEALQLLRKFRITEFWQKVNGAFMLAVMGGIATSLLSLAGLMKYLLENYAIQMWAFFFGLILISSPLILRQIKRWTIGVGLSISVGIAVAYLLTIVSPIQTPEALWFIFVSGILAGCAMMLPGTSGAFLLLLLGKYEYVLRSVINGNLTVVILFALGCIIGLLSFSNLITRLLDSHHDVTVALLAGLMIGSLNKVWPWKECLSYRLDTDGHQACAFAKSILPHHYLANTGEDPQIFQAIMLMALGVFLIVVIEKIAERTKTNF